MLDNATGIEGYFDAAFEREELHFREDVIRDAVESLVAFDDFDIPGNGWELGHFDNALPHERRRQKVACRDRKRPGMTALRFRQADVSRAFKGAKAAGMAVGPRRN